MAGTRGSSSGSGSGGSGSGGISSSGSNGSSGGSGSSGSGDRYGSGVVVGCMVGCVFSGYGLWCTVGVHWMICRAYILCVVYRVWYV